MTGRANTGSAVESAGLCELIGVDRDRLAALVASMAARGVTVAAAESLTAGLLTATLTEIPGASAVLRGGIVCYATDLKHTLVGVDADLLDRVGPVDPDVAAALAAGARDACGASIGIGLTGVAGPGPQDGIPAGTVFVAAASAQRSRGHRLVGAGAATDRWQVRRAAVRAGLDLLAALVHEPGTTTAAASFRP